MQRRRTTPLPSLRLAIWSGRAGPLHWGDDSQANGYIDTCLMTRLSLRCGDRDHPQFSAVVDCILKVWIDIDGSMSVEPMIHQAYLMGSDEVESRLRVLKTLEKKLARAGFPRYGFHRGSSTFDFLMAVCRAIGIRETMTYLPAQPGAEPNAEPIGIAVKRIAEILDDRLAELRLRKSA